MPKPQSKKKTSKTMNAVTPPTDILVLTESGEAGIQKFGAEQKIPAEKLREHLQKFTAALSSGFGAIQSLGGQFQLAEVEVQAIFSAEAGFIWVTKAGVEGGVTLKFVRRS
jgi:hypothetical protein